MSDAIECAYPDAKATSGYALGCRCARCRDGYRAAYRAWYETRTDVQRAATLARQRRAYARQRLRDGRATDAR